MRVGLAAMCGKPLLNALNRVIMFQYYGSKQSLLKYYPKPKMSKIIEPFAGSAKYSLRYFESEVLLLDKNEDIIKVWHYLQSASTKDILSLPVLKHGEKLDSFTLSEVERLFMGLVIVAAPFTTRNFTCSKMSDFAKGKNPLVKIANDLHKIRHWKIKHGSYEDLENEKATWFIDPPYFVGGHKYPKSNKQIDFCKLGDWCKSREGQVIVCENMNASWLDFKPISTHNGVNNIVSTEAVWMNQPTSYAVSQGSLFSFSCV
ncbi:MAG: DNA adenine methylase [Shewanella sp.]